MTLYVPEHFRQDDRAAQLALMKRHAFGTLISSGADGELFVSHVPFVTEDDNGRTRVLGHVARANPHARALETAARTMAVFSGPHAYVSPGWYQNHPSVPTWNYAVVHAHGRVRMMDEAQLHELLITLSGHYEAGRAKPWRMAELAPAYVDSMLKHITGFEIEVERLEGKFKLSQNRAAEVPRVIAALEAEGEAQLAGMMRDHSLHKA